MRAAIEDAVPVGFNQHEASKVRGSAHERAARPLAARLDTMAGKHPGLTRMQRRFDETWVCQLGTLGGGNHFIELCLDEARRVWVMPHSGSRGLGNCLGRYFIDAARREMERNETRLPDRDLAYFSEGSVWFDDYVEAVEWAQDYALANRRMSKSYSTCGVGACTLARRLGPQTEIGGQRPRFPTMRFTG